MFVLAYDVSAAKRVIATLLAAAMLMWTFGFYVTKADAANITSVSDVLSDTAPAALSNHTITFTSTNGVAAAGTIKVTFPAGFNLSTIVAGDVGLTVNGSAQTVAASPSGATWGAAVASQTLTLTSGSATVAAGQQVVITIGTNTTGGTHQIINPTPTQGDQSFEISISAGTDNGYARVVILNTVLVTARVATTFNFSVTGLSTSTAVNGTTTTGTASSTATPFGQLTEFIPKILGQRLNVSTNAANGYVVTVHDDGYFRSSTGATIHDFKNAATTGTTTPIAWAAPANNVNQNNTWGHWGLTSSDHSVAQRSIQFATDTWVGVSTTPTAIMGHSGPADGTTAGIGSTTVGYQVEISPLQPAGDDYATTLTYVATPTF